MPSYFVPNSLKNHHLQCLSLGHIARPGSKGLRWLTVIEFYRGTAVLEVLQGASRAESYTYSSPLLRIEVILTCTLLFSKSFEFHN